MVDSVLATGACPDPEELAALAAGADDGASNEAVRAHLDGCSTCRAVIANLVRGRAATHHPTAKMLTKGARVARYEIRDVVGMGAMGVVYLAFDPELHREVAVKLMRPHAGDVGAMLERLRRESRALAQLRHPNVTAVYDVGSFDDQVFIAMEYVEGCTLRRWLEREPRSWSAILDSFVQAGAGLAAAHRAGFVHRDFKPDNVLVDRDGRVLVSDFGLARPIGETETIADDHTTSSSAHSPSATPDSTLTLSGVRVGTPLYMAPEQISGGRVGPAADQFAFAVALYHALYLRRPFAGDDATTLFANVAEGNLLPPPSGSRVPARLFPVLRRALAVDPGARHPAMHDLIAALQRDPGPRRFWLTLVIAAIATLSAVAFGRARMHAAVEQGCIAEAELSDEWNETRGNAIREAMVAVGPHGVDVFERVAPILDDYATGWSRARLAVCRAVEVDHSQSTAAARAPIACLDRNRRALARALTRLERADAHLLVRATQLVSELPALANCEDPAWLRANIEPRLDAADAEVVARLYDELDGVRAAINAGDFAIAVALARGLEPEITAQGEPLLESAFVLEYGLAESAAGEYPAAQAHLSRAFHLALRARDDVTAARASVDLIDLNGRFLADGEASARWAQLAASAVARLDPPIPRLEVLRLRNLGLVANAQGHVQEAAELYEVGRRYAVEHLGSDHPLIVSLLASIATNSLGAGGFAAGIAAYEQVIAIREADLGPRHPGLVAPLVNLGNALQLSGDYDGALARYDRAATICTGAGSAGEPLLAAVYTNRAGIERALGRQREALVDMQNALEIDGRRLPPEHANVREDHLGIARLAIDLGDLTLARGHLESVTRELGDGVPERILRYRAEVEHARIELAERRPEAALERLVASDRVMAEHAPELDEVWAAALRLRATAEEHLGRTDDARATLERALGVGATDPRERAAVRRALAQAIEGRDPTRAAALRREADALWSRADAP